MAGKSHEFESMSEVDLVAACISRPVNQDAWRAFFKRFEKTVEGNVRRVLRHSVNDLDDVMQEAFSKIFEVLPTFDSTKSGLRTYLSHVITNVAIDCLRHGAKIRSITTSLEVEVGVFQVRARQDPELLRVAAQGIVDGLGDTIKARICHDVLRGVDVAEISKNYNVSKYSVYAAGRWLRDRIHEANSSLPGE